jgi:hypothetical protein
MNEQFKTQELGAGETGQISAQADKMTQYSAGELVVSLTALFWIFIIGFPWNNSDDLLHRIIVTSTRPFVLGVGVWLVLDMFVFLLSRRTILVGLVRGLTDFPSESVLVVDLDERKTNNQWADLLQVAKEALVKQKERNDREAVSHLNAFIQKVHEKLAEDKSDTVKWEFQEYLHRSRAAASMAQRRPNALLFIGTIIALLGLVFFIVTLPDSRFGIVLPSTGPAEEITSHDVWSTGLRLLPRLLMLIFIQVLAGFFLRQYRASMEDFRYYESILRDREAQ